MGSGVVAKAALSVKAAGSRLAKAAVNAKALANFSAESSFFFMGAIQSAKDTARFKSQAAPNQKAADRNFVASPQVWLQSVTGLLLAKFRTVDLVPELCEGIFWVFALSARAALTGPNCKVSPKCKQKRTGSDIN